MKRATRFYILKKADTATIDLIYDDSCETEEEAIGKANKLKEIFPENEYAVISCGVHFTTDEQKIEEHERIRNENIAKELEEVFRLFGIRKH